MDGNIVLQYFEIFYEKIRLFSKVYYTFTINDVDELQQMMYVRLKLEYMFTKNTYITVKNIQ